jgi:hypothetical protein
LPTADTRLPTSGVYTRSLRPYIRPVALSLSFEEPVMRAEAEKLADAVRQSLALLRRHL